MDSVRQQHGTDHATDNAQTMRERPEDRDDNQPPSAMDSTVSVGDEQDLEGQPFLNDALSSDPREEKHQTQPSRSSSRKLAVYLTCLVLLLFFLSKLALGLVPSPGHHDEDEDDHGEGEHHHDDEDEDHAEVVHYDEDAPAVPRVRDASEYVLDTSWDLDAAPKTREYHWTIADAELNPDGVYRPMILINNQFPGPLVECNDGDSIVVHIDNHAVNATSIHFHGLYQNGSNAMDGTVGVTQCPIAPNSSFTYAFDVRGQSGTYWYHAHRSAQASDGVLGPVVIHSHDERDLQELDYVSDRVVMLQDHYHNTTAELLMDYLKPGMENDEPVPDNALINGRGARDCADFPGWRCNSTETSPTIFDLAKGQRHRLRFVNVGAFAEFQVQFDEHPFYITEVDGTDVHPEPFHRLNILPAQRYSVVIETNATESDVFWMRARMVAHCFTTKNKRLQTEIRAVVRYVAPGAELPDPEPTSEEWPDAIEVVCRDLNTTALHPVVAATPPPADDFVILRANFEIGAWRLARGFFNDSSWHPNATRPSLHRFLDAAPADAALSESLAANEAVFDRATELVLQTTGVRTVDISINNFDDGSHPFHLHGHKFWVVAQGRSGYPPASAAELAPLVPHNPLRRDTVTVEGYAWAVVRVTLDNPGLWTLHCHNAWHADSGMVMQLLVRSDVVRGWDVDPADRAMCELGGVERGSRPDDSIWFGQF